MQKAYKYRINPSKKQETLLEQTLGICCELYNAGLLERRDAYRVAGKSISYLEQANQLPQIKQVREDLCNIHSQVLQDALKRLERLRCLLPKSEQQREARLSPLSCASAI